MKINVNCEIYDLPTTRCLISGAKYVYFNLKILFFHTSENKTKCIVMMYKMPSTTVASFMASESEVQALG